MEWYEALILFVALAAIVIGGLFVSRSDWWNRLSSQRAEKQREEQIESGQHTADSTASIDDKMDQIIDTLKGTKTDTAEPLDDTPQPP